MDPILNPFNQSPISLRGILALFSHLRLGLLSDYLLLVFPTKMCYAFIVSLRRATCPDHLTMKFMICNLFPPCCYSFLSLNI
jgi:hypothetical protein